MGRDINDRVAREQTHPGTPGSDSDIHELEMWVDVTVRFPASPEGTGMRFDFFNLKRAVEAMSAAGVADPMGIEILQTERGLEIRTSG